MIYVFDTSAFRDVFKSYYKERFPSLWEKFDAMILNGSIVSTREVMKEIEEQTDDLKEWSEQNQDVFSIPTPKEAGFIREIYNVKHFQANIEQKKLLKGGKNADPFVIAAAAGRDPIASVVTLEKEKPGAAKIPNICKHFKVPCINLEQFMEAEDWRF
ncbi:DUF4411 family protein [Hahella sp. CR1]|uniref:PIN domain-containing protein n=1 Tax=Hahella sp. CR1 TaxID=2992807 RepID=UPI002442A80C|nr:PIN domain-containing protein [Hahella sp. CR1]MDG9669419.1 DUF4411 family protein [Hahella sp. CR1]